jgi:hypothetical protein
MTRGEVWDILVAEFGDGDCIDENLTIVPPKPEMAWGWKWNGPTWADFITTLTVMPSIDASDSGHWHGFITNGQVVGGVQAA